MHAREPSGKGAGGKGVCYEFREQGKCRRGDKCWYLHDAEEPAKNKKEEKTARAQKVAAEAAAAAEQSAGAVNAQAKGSGKGAGAKGGGKGKGRDDGDPKDSICRQVLRGATCRYGDECKFSHEVELFNDDGSKRRIRSSQNQTPAKKAEDKDDWGKPVGLRSNVCGYAKQYPVPFAADSASHSVKSGWMIASAAIVKPAAGCIKALTDLPEDWWTLTESDTGGYQYQTEVEILGVPLRTLLDGCAGVNSITEETVLGALNLAKQKGINASDPSFPIIQLERWKSKEVITGVRKDAVIRIIGAAVLRIRLTLISGKPGPEILVRAKIFEAGASEFPGFILGGRALDCVENGGLGFRPETRSCVRGPWSPHA